MLSGPFLVLLAPLAIWGIPGFALSRWILPGVDPLQRVVTSLGMGIVTVAPTTFLIAVGASIPETPELIALVAAAWTLIGWAGARRLPGWGKATPGALGAFDSRVLLLVAATVATLTTWATTPYATETTEVWWHCPHMSSLYLIEDGHGPGVRAWDPTLDIWVRHLFQHPTEPGFGLGPVLGIQRPGNTAFLVQPLVFLSSSGLAVALWCVDFMVLAFAMLLLSRGLRSPWLIAPLAIVFHFGQRALAAYQVNENSTGLAIGMLVLHLVLDARRSGGAAGAERAPLVPIGVALMAAVALAHLCGIRPVMLLCAPAALLLLGARPRTAALFAVALVVMGTPWMLAHGLALGDPLTHPALNYGRQEQTVLGMTFTFHPLGWPFSALAAGPKHPYPMLIRLPLEQLQALGAPLLTLAAAGLVALRGDWRRLVGALAWILPVQLVLMAIVQLDYQKMSYVTLSLAPLPWLVGLGLGRLELLWPGRIALAAACLMAFVFVPLSLRDLQLPVDTRGHGDYLMDARDLAGPKQRRQQLTAASFGPYVSGEMDLLNGGRTAELMRYARPAVVGDAEAPIDAPLITVWAALPPSPLAYELRAQTMDAPTMPDGFLGSGLDGAGAMSKGSALYLVRLPAPAPLTVSIVLRRTNGKLELTASAEGTETSETDRWVSILIVDRQHRFQAGRFSVLGDDSEPFTVTLWRQLDGDWEPQPRLVSNAPMIWTEEGFTFGDDEQPRYGAWHGFERVCEDAGEGGAGGIVVLEQGYRRDQTLVMTTTEGIPVAVRPPANRFAESRILGFGRGFPSPTFGQGPCASRFLGRPAAPE